MVILITFFTVFSYSIGNGLMISNIIYYMILLKSLFNKRSVYINKNKVIILWYLLMITAAVMSHCFFAISINKFEFRNIVQLFFTIQYFIFIIKPNINVEKIELWLFRFSFLLSTIIIGLYVIKGEYRNISNLYGSMRMWASGYIPGWPNSTPIPLLIGFFISIKNKQSYIIKSILIVGLLLTTSRGALLGIAMIITYFIYKEIKKDKIKWIIILIPFLVFVLLFYNDMLNIVYTLIPSLKYRMSVSYDRQDIFNATMNYVKLRPIFGYGGNTLDQIVTLYGNASELGINWGHTHNWILETFLRYGIVGLISFGCYMNSIRRRIIDKDKKFMFTLLLILSLFQTYMRNFSILFLFLYSTLEDRNIEKKYQSTIKISQEKGGN